MPKAPSMKLGSLKHGRGNFFGTPPPTFSAKSKRTKPKKNDLNHVQNSKHKTYKLKMWPKQFFLLLASYFWRQKQETKSKTFALNHAQISMHKVGTIFFYVQPPIFNAKNRRPKVENFDLDHAQNSKQKTQKLKMWPRQFFCSQPPTFGAENRRPGTKEIALNHAQICMHRVGANYFFLCLASYFRHQKQEAKSRKF